MSLLIVGSLTSAQIHFFLKHLEHGSQEGRMGNRAKRMAEGGAQFQAWGQTGQSSGCLCWTINPSWLLVTHCRLGPLRCHFCRFPFECSRHLFPEEVIGNWILPMNEWIPSLNVFGFTCGFLYVIRGWLCSCWLVRLTWCPLFYTFPYPL